MSNDDAKRAAMKNAAIAAMQNQDEYGSGDESYSDKAKRAAMKNAAIAAMENQGGYDTEEEKERTSSNPYIKQPATIFIPTETPSIPVETVSTYTPASTSSTSSTYTPASTSSTSSTSSKSSYTPPISSESSYKIPLLVLLVVLIIGIILFFVLKNKNSVPSVNNIVAAFGKIW